MDTWRYGQDEVPTACLPMITEYAVEPGNGEFSITPIPRDPEWRDEPRSSIHA